MRTIRLWLLITALALGAWAKPLKFPVRRYFKEAGLAMEVYLTEVNAYPRHRQAWCYRTVGHKPDLAAVVLLEKHDLPERFPESPFKMLACLKNSKAAPGELVQTDDLAMVHPKMAGVLVLGCERLKGVPKATRCLAVIPITPNERTVAVQAGVSRLIGGLANQARYYPSPFWIDRKRQSAYSDVDLHVMQSPLWQVPVYHSRASVLVTGNRCSLCIYPTEARKLGARLEQARKTGLRVSLVIDTRADGFLVWTADHLPAAVTPPGGKGQKMSAQFLCLVPGQKTNQCSLLEDGYALLITNVLYDQLVESLKKGKPGTWKLDGSPLKFLAIEAKGGLYYNPTDGSVMVGDWTHYRPDQPTKPTGPVEVKEVVLLTPEDQLFEAVSADVLAHYVGELDSVCLAKLVQIHPKTTIEVVATCDLGPKRPPRYKIALKNKGLGADAALEALYQALPKVKAPVVTDSVRFNLHFTIKPH